MPSSEGEVQNPTIQGCQEKPLWENYYKPYRNRTLVGGCEYIKVDGITMLKELCKTAIVTSG